MKKRMSGRMKAANAKGSPKKVTAAKMTGAKVKTGRTFGKGGAMARKHD